MSGPDTPPPVAAFPWRGALLLFLCAAAFHAAGTWSLPLLDRDEPRFAEASREMIERGDWIVPWFNNQPRYDKPPLIYWAQIIAYRTLGEREFAARLPSVLATALTAVIILGFGRRLRDAPTGWWAALIYSTSLQTMIHAKLSVADPLMILFFTLAAWAGWELGRPDPRGEAGPRHLWWTIFTISLALAFLAKGPVGCLPLVLPVIAARMSNHAVPWKHLRLVRTAGLTLLLIALWGIPALVQTGGEFWSVGMGKHVVQRSFDVLEGHGARSIVGYLATLPFYFLAVFFSFFPWSLRLVGWVRETWQRRTNLGFDESYLVAGTVLVFGVFTLVRTKLPHYTLPAFPLLSLALTLAWQRAGGPGRVAKRWVIAMTVFGLVTSLIIIPLVAPHFAAVAMARACRPWLKPEMEFATARFGEPSVCWYFRRDVDGFHQSYELEELAAYMAKPGPRLCILPTADVTAAFPNVPSDWKQVRVQGINVARGTRVDLTAFIELGPGTDATGEPER